MKKDILNRYARDDAGRIVIEVAADCVEDLYSNFDRRAPYVRRDLDANLVDYLIDCGRELGDEPYSIRFLLARSPQQQELSRIRHSVGVYFHYLVETERQQIRRMFRRSLVLLGIGVVILFVAVAFRALEQSNSVIGEVFAEGLTVAAWVSLWEALATFLVEWFPHRGEIRLYRRLAAAPLLFPSVPEPSGADPARAAYSP